MLSSFSWEQIAAPTCGTCDIALSRPFVCSQCSYAGCWSDGHVVAHLKESAHMFCKSLHLLSSQAAEHAPYLVVINRCWCKKWICLLFWMRQFYLSFKTWCIISCYDCSSWRETNGFVSLHIAFSVIGLISPPATHKPKESFKPWIPSQKEIQALEGAEPIACQGELSTLQDFNNLIVFCRPPGTGESRADLFLECSSAVSCP